MSIFEYSENGTIPELEPASMMAFNFIVEDIDINKRKWEEMKEVRSEAGKKGAKARWKKPLRKQKKMANDGKRILPMANDGKHAVNVNVNVNDNVNDIYICSFERFWNKYPRRIGKAKAQVVYKRKASSLLKEKKIMEGLEKYITKWKVEKTLNEYIPHPTTWLNEERWNDEVEIGREVENKNFRKFEDDMQKKKEEFNKNYVKDDNTGKMVKLSDYLEGYKGGLGKREMEKGG